VRLKRGTIEDPPGGPYDAITAADVLFYHPFEFQIRVLERCRGSVGELKGKILYYAGLKDLELAA
jgi:hypothetical protein